MLAYLRLLFPTTAWYPKAMSKGAAAFLAVLLPWVKRGAEGW